MSLSEKEYELIEKFLTDTLSEGDRSDLMQSLKNEAFRKEIEFQAGMTDAMKTAEENSIRETLHKGGLASDRGSAKIFSLKSLLRYAAALAIVLASWFGFKHLNYNQQVYNIVAQHNVSFPPDNFERGQSQQISYKYKEAMGYYANQNYELAYNLFLDLNPQTEKIILYRANCLLEIGEIQTATSLLNSIINSNDDEIKQNAEWYMAIARLLNKNPGEARNILRVLAKDKDHLFSEKAKKLLRSL